LKKNGSLGIAVIDQHIWRCGVSRIGNPTYIWRCVTENPREPIFFGDDLNNFIRTQDKNQSCVEAISEGAQTGKIRLMLKSVRSTLADIRICVMQAIVDNIFDSPLTGNVKNVLSEIHKWMKEQT
jgi:hypothetical protein